jgi:hypothetical protein
MSGRVIGTTPVRRHAPAGDALDTSAAPSLSLLESYAAARTIRRDSHAPAMLYRLGVGFVKRER